jgi:hypothetical protein
MLILQLDLVSYVTLVDELTGPTEIWEIVSGKNLHGTLECLRNPKLSKIYLL